MKKTTMTFLTALSFAVAGQAFAASCEGYGPQTPRDIDNLLGENKRVFSKAPASEHINLCNIHFHKNAEHKAKDFSVFAGDSKYGGYQCNATSTLTAAELKAPKGKVCKNVKPGDTIEVHWVHSSCDVTPGKGLGSCLSDKCANPQLRVETQVFMVVNDENAFDFNDLDYDSNMVNGYHQAKHIPNTTGKPVEFLGSTTGPSYTEQQCSPLQVTWSVRPACAKIDINSLATWCENNEFEEDHAHGVRQLVTDPKLLSPIN
ncbi:delta-class carbonic anhydrase [Pseudoalteromonas aurantia]|uniref:Cadmium carbonic anhydrase n=1 Tax=Pseudoalteromonas aurantia TaxID=43654 RepID=A0A5S3V758_9GAMM|nr:delta-class carbonic anhydrase [Pseudoalteromonas aurantia]TMO66480.1 cadmium carbonic anhydrase [Pseudoalteromonas aurantia]TMO66553.1 cadmium carbonic anhydrase [Pseudoalteromonas aurantia]TMO74235.1 cadmium carbonic anhydrase [Pseudoalteromonas aurantia]